VSSQVKCFIFGMLIGIVCFSIGYLLNYNPREFMIMLAQSIVDNAIFCVMFIIVVLVTGISV
jgi:ABC-type transporter Mla maintaining outer membrane lipid asymmetry permease subunit MlaE